MLTLLFLAASGVVEVTVLTVRSWFDGREGFATGFRPLVELFRRFGIAFYSAILAGVVIGWLLLQSLPMWSFQHSADRRRAWR